MSLKYKVRLNQTSDVEKIMSNISEMFRNKGVDGVETVNALAKIEDTVSSLSERGSAMIKVGSAMTAKQIVKGAGYHIQIEARFPDTTSILSKFKNVFGL